MVPDTKNRIAIFAHYDKNNLIQDYVVFYLKELKKIAKTIVFVSDGEIQPKELTKISDITDVSITHRHGEYDFGSYKRGYLYLKENNLLNDCDELIFCNDSCYAPLFDIQDFYNKMSEKKLDFWGNTLSKIDAKNIFSPHIQSYFIVLSSKVFNSDIFYEFILSVKKEKSKVDIISNYEIKLTRILSEQGYKWDVYCNTSKKYNSCHNLRYKDLIKKDKSPFVKTSIYRNIYIYRGIIPNYNVISKNSNYDLNLIKNDLKYNKYKNIIQIIIEQIFHKIKLLCVIFRCDFSLY